MVDVYKPRRPQSMFGSVFRGESELETSKLRGVLYRRVTGRKHTPRQYDGPLNIYMYMVMWLSDRYYYNTC
jgi:hypothetical protein